MPLSAEQKKRSIELFNAMVAEPSDLTCDNATQAKLAFRALSEAERDFAGYALLYFHLAQTHQSIPEWLSKAMAEA